MMQKRKGEEKQRKKKKTLTTMDLLLTRKLSLHFWMLAAPTQWMVRVVCMPSAGK